MARWCLLLVALALAGCPEEVAPLGDREAPAVQVYGVTPTGTRVEPVDGVILVPTVELSLRIEASEPGSVYYTTDGAEPGPRTGGVARNAAVLPLTEDADVRYLAQDLAGNAGTPGQVSVRFDRQAPTLTIDPLGGRFPGPVDVVVSVDEPATLWWSTDGVAPVPATGRGEVSEAAPGAPVTIRLVRDTTLRLLAIDR
ncbi:MAG: chitobiase/beta-hexosaminidase C-terminal domain-containing protein, partial [bacterium]